MEYTIYGSHLLPLKSMIFNKNKIKSYVPTQLQTFNKSVFSFTPKTIRYLVNSGKLIILVSYASAFHIHTCLSVPKWENGRWGSGCAVEWGNKTHNVNALLIKMLTQTPVKESIMYV